MTDDLLRAIRVSMDERGYPPSVRELAHKFNVSVGTIHKRMVDLEASGRIKRETKGGHTKVLRITDEGETT